MKKILIPILAIFISFLIIIYRGSFSMLPVAFIVLSLLIFFTILAKILTLNKSRAAEEITKRTISWWWMVAIFIIAVTTHRLIIFCFLGFLCFLTLREYFSLMPVCNDAPTAKKPVLKNLPQFVCYFSILLSVCLAYIKWYGLYIVFVPVYVFLAVPIIFVLQNRTAGTIRSLGFIYVGLMFFVFNLGHSFFMINLGIPVLVYCFLFTELRDVLAYWAGKTLELFYRKFPQSFILRILNSKIAESINPKKTWGAGLIAAGLIGGLSLLFVPVMPEFPEGKLTYFFAAILGLSIGLFGLMGDLVFSMIKRDIGIKDTGSILPGHGGIIDRVNSLVFTIPIVFHLIVWKYF
ncbi:MAG: phosphatidate cytidylyltransferase [Candidatus Omnitrophica bacterium]|jgi:phosphatidate cytidylyltransferase|nr:phosphatidate cytidylyltransferase [Candidatus Omnitrophota bacterium]